MIRMTFSQSKSISVKVSFVVHCTTNIHTTVPLAVDGGHCQLTIETQSELSTLLDYEEVQIIGEAIGDGSFGRVRNLRIPSMQFRPTNNCLIQTYKHSTMNSVSRYIMEPGEAQMWLSRY